MSAPPNLTPVPSEDEGPLSHDAALPEYQLMCDQMKREWWTVLGIAAGLAPELTSGGTRSITAIRATNERVQELSRRARHLARISHDMKTLTDRVIAYDRGDTDD